jgi:hypothetical protein
LVYEVMALMRTTMSARSLCPLPVFVLVAGIAVANGYPGSIVEPVDAADQYATWNDFRLRLYGNEANECPVDLNGDGVLGQPDPGILPAASGVNDGGDIDRDSDTDVQDLIFLLGVCGEGRP